MLVPRMRSAQSTDRQLADVTILPYQPRIHRHLALQAAVPRRLALRQEPSVMTGSRHVDRQLPRPSCHTEREHLLLSPRFSDKAGEAGNLTEGPSCHDACVTLTYSEPSCPTPTSSTTSRNCGSSSSSTTKSCTNTYSICEDHVKTCGSPTPTAVLTYGG